MTQFTRRDVLKTGLAAAGATFAISGTKSSGNILGANDRIRVAVAGINGRGNSHIGEFGRIDGVEIACLVDPDTRLWEGKAKSVRDRNGNTPRTIKDVREAIDDPNIDVISVATPNHWHSLITIWACQGGKDVYVEKPCSHNVHEGRVAVEAARKHNRIVQHGTQNRSSGHWAKVVAAIESGKYGPLKVARGLCYKRRGSIGFKAPSPPPNGLDFDLWLGPAPEQPYHGNLVHYNWHWFWETGNGDIGNQGVHEIDKARWGIPGAKMPKSVVSLGGRFGYEDQGETANTQIAVFDYGDTQLIFEVRGLVPKNEITNLFHFEDGTIRPDGKFYRTGSDKGEPLPEVEVNRGPGDGHFGNFIAAVRSRKIEDLNADIQEGHYSSALCHLANISYRLGEPVPFDQRRGVFKDNEAASETFERMREHLSEQNVKLDDTQYRLGPVLHFDSKAEQFVGSEPVVEKANQLLTRRYRAPYVVPEKLS